MRSEECQISSQYAKSAWELAIVGFCLFRLRENWEDVVDDSSLILSVFAFNGSDRFWKSMKMVPSEYRKR